MSNPNETPNGYSNQGYTLRADIILSAFVFFFFLMFLRCCCWACINPGETTRRRRRRLLHLMSGRQTHHHVFYVDPTNPNPESVTVTRGLDASVLKSLPVFTYSSKTHPDSSLECAVCLSEFEENESGRVLPKCNHSFHLDCIDMWFHSHSTCPTCRSTVEPGMTRPEIPAEVVLTITEPPSVNPASCGGSVAESDIERGKDEAK